MRIPCTGKLDSNRLQPFCQGWIKNVDYHFTQWSDGSAENPRTDENVTADISVTASFEPTMFTLTISVDGNGTTTPEPGEHSYQENSTIDIVAIPDEGHTFEKWLVNGEEDFTENLQIVITGDTQVTAMFEEVPTSVTTFSLNDIEIFPNPFDNELNILHDPDLENITITNIVGEVVARFDIDNSEKTTLTIGDLPEGIYLIKLTSRNNDVVIRKVIKH